MTEIKKIEKDNDITQEKYVCFEPSKFKIREETIFPQILALHRFKKMELIPQLTIVKNNQILKLDRLDLGSKLK